jgi:hypothetical protein
MNLKIITVMLFTLFSFLSYANENTIDSDPALKSISALEFSPEGILFIGDSIDGKIIAIDLKEKAAKNVEKPPVITDIEQQVAALMAAKSSDVLIHDMAVNPISKSIYLAVSRGRANWTNRWHRPNELENASMLVKINVDGSFEEINLKKTNYSVVYLPNPVSDQKINSKGRNKGKSNRMNSITQLAYKEGKLYVAGLSNEEFASAMWTFTYPFVKNVTATTFEIYHGVHDRFETHSPVRAFIPYDFNGVGHILAAYLCTPLVSFPLTALENGAHIKGKTIAELGSGNIPIDMISLDYEDKKMLIMSNTALPLMTFNVADIESNKSSITEPVESFTAGISYQARASGGVQQIDNFDDEYIVTTRRTSSGKLELSALRKIWLVQ